MSSDINVQTFSGKVNINNNLLVGSSHLFVDTVNNRVGITTADPDAGLHVNSNAYVHTDFRVGSGIVMNDTTGQITAGSFVGDGSAMTGINSDSGSWVNGTNSNVHLATSTDKVGIGTTSPQQKLDLGDLGGGSIRLGRDHDDDNTSTNRIGRTGVGNDIWYSSVNFIDEDTNDDAISFVTHRSGVGPFERMRISGNGNVGIGTTDPGAPLDVFAPVASGTQRTALKLTTPESTTGTGCNLDFFQSTANVGRLASVYEAAGQLGMSFSTWNSGLGERVRIDASGNVGIGTTDPDAKLHVNGGDFKISAAGGGGLYDNNYQWLECDNDASWYRLARTAKTNGIACYNGIAINQEGGLVVGSWDSPNALGVGNGKFTGTVTASTFSATSRINIGTSASIRQSSSAWTGDPGSGVGKIEYHSNRWYVVAGSNSTELLRVRRNDSDKFFITNEGNIGRTSHSNGYLVGSYNNVGGNDTKTNPIYTIGSNYRPTDTSLSNMYGIGYSHGNFTSILTDGWGMYVASDGDARIGLNAQHGHIKCTGHVYCGNTVYVGGSTTRGLRGVSGDYGTVQTTGEGAGNHEGYSIDGRWVFMSGDSNSCGI